MASKSPPLSRRSLLQATAAGVATATVGGGAAAGTTAPAIDWHAEVDVLVCGSGAAGGTAALYAAKGGASVLLLEKGASWGGTTAKSGCHIWIPNNHELRKRGVVDERRHCLQYMAQYSYPYQFQEADAQLGLEENTFALLEAFYDNAAPMVEQMIAWKAFDFRAAQVRPGEGYTPDYYDHSPYNKVPMGRGLEPYKEGVRYAVGRHVVQQMRSALFEEEVDVRMRTRVRRLHLDDSGAVLGVAATNDAGETLNLRARQGVIMATGCYSHNAHFLRQYQMLPVFGSCAIATNEGDVIPIAGEAGAQMGNMSGAWRAQVVLEETLAYKSVPSAVYWPPGDSMILVDKSGRRFVNEKRPYNDRTRAMYNFDASEVGSASLINFMIYDERTAQLRAGMHPIPPIPSAADYVIRGETLAALAGNIATRLEALSEHTGSLQLDADFALQLERSVERFNAMAARGKDEDFGRGSYAQDRGWFRLFPEHPGTRWQGAREDGSTLYPLQSKGPYYAIVLAPGVLGTNGGPVVNRNAQVLDYRNRPIPGLYAAGNCMAHPAGNAYWAAGATIGSAMTFGKIAGEHALNRALEPTV